MTLYSFYASQGIYNAHSRAFSDMDMMKPTGAMERETVTPYVRSNIVAKQPSVSPTRSVSWKFSQELGIERSAIIRAKRRARFRQNQTLEQVKLQRPRHNHTVHNITIDPEDTIYYLPRLWDAAPIVIPEYKLVFFTIPKVGCTVFKQLFRRIAQCPDWRTHDYELGLPHDPERNSLTYLYHYSVDDALYIMTSEEWTRAVFVRDPMDRIISAYLDKAQPHPHGPTNNNHLSFVARVCCPRVGACGTMAQHSFQDFVHMTRWCPNPHWDSQSRRMENKFWPTITFVGHLETAQTDVKALLERVGAWELYGAAGWGINGTEPIFASKSTVRHKTNSQNQRTDFCNNETVALVEALYADDLQNPLFGFHGNGQCSGQ